MSGLRVFSRMPKKEIIERLKRFKEAVIRRYPNIIEVILVGSVARDEHGPFSDVDVVVIYEGEEPDYAELKIELAKTVDIPADLILLRASELSKLTPRARKEWLENGLRI